MSEEQEKTMMTPKIKDEEMQSSSQTAQLENCSLISSALREPAMYTIIVCPEH